MAQKYFATINPGLEAALVAEIRELGGKRAQVLTGGVEFDATNTVFYRALQRLRAANRLWMRIDEFRARDAPELFNKTRRIDWARLIPKGTPVEVRASARSSRLIHTDRISGAVSDAINEALGQTEPKGAPLTVLARLDDDRCQLSLDASGELLYRRGWKTEAVTAPLRESVAAALLHLSDWNPGLPLMDPFCGSGSIVIEAAQLAMGLAAGSSRKFDAQLWANYRPELWKSVAAEVLPATPTMLWGSDIDAKAVAAARHNAESAGVLEWCTFERADVANVSPSTLGSDGTPGWIITNPPWNLRLEDPNNEGLTALLKSFDKRFEGWGLAVLAPRRWSLPDGEVIAKFELGGTPVSFWARKP